MTLDSTLKKSKKKQKPPKKSKRSSASPGRCRRCCGRFTTFLFSHVGLCALVIGYSIMGAFAFRALEAPYEEQKASQVGHLRQETVRRLWEITDKLNVLYKDNWTELVEAEVRRFQKELIVAVKEGYDGKEGSGQQWSFSGAFLYSLTVITTIGKYFLMEISHIKIEYCNICLLNFKENLLLKIFIENLSYPDKINFRIYRNYSNIFVGMYINRFFDENQSFGLLKVKF
ncbi:UNVERIFIED_CONTAM: twk-7 [Trichonephila clavipes]